VDHCFAVGLEAVGCGACCVRAAAAELALVVEALEAVVETCVAAAERSVAG
jgi:hypothetical protein